MFIESFKIKALFGYKDVEINFENPILIIIGENGFGKTTILNALNYTLQGCYNELLDIKFESIEISIMGSLYSFTHSQLQDYNEYLSINSSDNNSTFAIHLKNHLSSKDFDLLCKKVSEGRTNFRADFNNNPIIRQFPDSFIYREIKEYVEREKRFGVFISLKEAIEKLNYNILFKPTYRRVEADLDSTIDRNRRMPRMVGGVDDERPKSYAAKIIRFGMNDVQSMISKVTDNIKNSSLQGFAKVSSDMIRHLLDDNTNTKKDLDLDIDSLRIILGRTGDNLSENEKEKIIKQIEDKKSQSNPYLDYFLEQLYNVYKTQESLDTAIKNFRDVCNRYLRDKQFVYDESQVELKIYRKTKDQSVLTNDYVVDLNNLSSGEKQIVSLFAQIYLDIDKKFVMLLDEPELSLSIYWQQTLLADIYKSGRCELLFVVTHSPFIFNNSMKEYVVGLQEFLKNREIYG